MRFNPACRKSFAFAPSCLRTGPLAPFAPNDGFRRSLRFARLGTRLAGRRGVILNEKGASARLSAREASHRSDTHLRVQSPLLFQAFPRTFLLLLCLFRQSEAQPAGWAFLIPLRHSSFSPQNFAAQTFAGAPPYGPRRKAGIHFITPTQPLKPLGKAIPGRFCFCNNTLYNHFCPDAGQG